MLFKDVCSMDCEQLRKYSELQFPADFRTPSFILTLYLDQRIRSKS